jgi:hypothetical protein
MDNTSIGVYLEKVLMNNEFENFDPSLSVEEFSNRRLTEKVAHLLNEIAH